MLVKLAYVILAVVSLFPFVPAPAALVTGVAFAMVLGNPYLTRTRALTPKLLAYSIVALGAGMDLRLVASAGLQGIGYTAVGIALTLALGLALGKLLRTEAETSLLVSVGTAICGGSA